MHTQETIEAVFTALLDPDADFIDAATELSLPLTEFLEIAESPQITAAIEALEKLARIRERALLARAAHTAIAALERIADSDPETPGARETARKAAAQLLRMADKAAASREEPDLPTQTANAPPATPAATPSSTLRAQGAGESATSPRASTRLGNPDVPAAVASLAGFVNNDDLADVIDAVANGGE